MKAAFICGWFVVEVPEGRMVTNAVMEALLALPHECTSLVWPEADPKTGEPTAAAAMVLVEAPEETIAVLDQLPGVERVGGDAAKRDGAETYLREKGVNVSLAAARSSRDAADRIAQSIQKAAVVIPEYFADLA